jgi:hypothetical protein
MFEKLLREKKYKQAYGLMIENAMIEKGGEAISIVVLNKGRELIEDTILVCKGTDEECHNRVLSLFEIDFVTGLIDAGAPKTAGLIESAVERARRPKLSVGSVIGGILISAIVYAQLRRK